MKALLLGIVLTLSPKIQKEPRWKYLDLRGNYRITNPLHRPVHITIDCGADWNPFHLDVPAATSLEIQVNGPDAETAVCIMTDWR